jgi:transcriptional regulator with XRE-family HTH domain
MQIHAVNVAPAKYESQARASIAAAKVFSVMERDVRQLRLARIAWLRDKRFDGSQAALAKAIGRSESQLSQWFNGVRTITEDSARHIERALRLNPGELDTPIGSTTDDTPPTPAPPSAASPPPAPDPLEVLAAKLDALEPSMREHAVDTLKRYLLAAPAERARWRPLVDPLLLPTADPDRVAAHLQPAPRKRKTK